MNIINNILKDIIHSEVISDKPIMPIKHAQVIFYLSFLGFLTGLMGIYCGKKLLGFSVIIGALISINYWRFPNYGQRRTVDMLYMQYLVFIHSFYIWNTPMMPIFCLFMFIGLIFYFMSWFYYEKNALLELTICH